MNCNSNVHNITFFYVQEKQILIYKELADRFAMAVAIPGTRAYHCFRALNSRSVTTAGASLLTSFTTYQITTNTRVKQHRHTAFSNDYAIFIYCLWLWWSLVVGYCSKKRQDHMFYVKFMQPHRPNSNFFQMLLELLSQIEKKHRSRCTYWSDINHTHECTWNGTYICLR
jgi:hypothetical protein